MSSRRSTLKRPIVCKSKKHGDCGACDFEIRKPPEPVPPGSLEDWSVRLSCDPDPTDLSFELTVYGAFQPVLPLPEVEPNADTHFDLQSPGTKGVYLVKMALKNGDGCIFVNEVTVTVGP